MTVISLLSDFGNKDPYVAEMKAVILSINPQTQIIDITHETDKYNIRIGAYILASAAPYFPPKTVHVAVVDPGVGTKRRPIIVETRRSTYVGPDNGLLMLAAHKDGITKVHVIDNPKYMLTNVSKTFHGRDIFAPAAAHLTNGVNPSEFGPEINDYVFPEYAKPQTNKDTLTGEVIHIDGFGNIVTNISAENLEENNLHKGDALLVKLGAKDFNLKLLSAYGETPVEAPLALVGSSNFLEIALNQGNAAKLYKTNIGDKIQVSRKTSK